MRAILTICLLAGLAAPAAAIEINVDRAWEEYGSAKALVAVTNDDEPKGYSAVGIDCTFLLDGRAVLQSAAPVRNLAHGETAWATVARPTKGKPWDEARCRVGFATPNR